MEICLIYTKDGACVHDMSNGETVYEASILEFMGNSGKRSVEDASMHEWGALIDDVYMFLEDESLDTSVAFTWDPSKLELATKWGEEAWDSPEFSDNDDYGDPFLEDDGEDD